MRSWRELPSWLAAQFPHDVESRWFDVGGVSMHALVRGSERDPIVLMLHGNPTWSFLYRDIIGHLSGTYSVAPDLIGLGLSDRPRSAAAHNLAQHETWVATLIEQLPKGPIVGVVQDWGGAIFAGAVAQSGRRLAGLVVLNTVLTAPQAGFTPTLFHRLTGKPSWLDGWVRRFNLIERAMPLAQGRRSSISGDVARAYRWPLGHARGNEAPLALSRMVPSSMEHPSVAPLEASEAWLRRWSGPVEILWGREDPVLGRMLRRTRRLFPDARVTETDGGHFLQEEHPELIARAVMRVVGKAT